jgi:hypothetical protein
MEEILASIRKFVTDNPPEDPRKQKVYKGDISGATVIPPADHALTGVHRPEHIQLSPLDAHTPHTAPYYAGQQDVSLRDASYPSSSPISQGHPVGSHFEHDVLELNTPLPQHNLHGNPGQMKKQSHEHHAPWTPPSKTSFQKKTLEDSILNLTASVGSSDLNKGKPSLSAFQAPSPDEITDPLVSTQTIAASATSLTRLAQASKTVPKRPSLAEQRNVTLDQLIQDLIRPMIKQWIDAHLPSLVEEMVAKEIKRITKHVE